MMLDLPRTVPSMSTCLLPRFFPFPPDTHAARKPVRHPINPRFVISAVQVLSSGFNKVLHCKEVRHGLERGLR